MTTKANAEYARLCRIEIAKLSLKSGDTLMMYYPPHTNVNVIEKLKSMMQRILPRGSVMVCVPVGYKFEVIESDVKK